MKNIYKNSTNLVFFFLAISLVAWSWNDLKYFEDLNYYSTNLSKILSWQSLIKNFDYSDNDSFSPVILIYFFKIAYFFGGNIVVLLLDKIIIPFFCIYFIFLIYRNYISPSISLCLAILSVIFFSDLPLREILLKFFLFREFTYFPNTLEISSGDYYSLSLLISLIIIYFTIQNKIITYSYTFKFSLLYSLLLFLNPFDFIFTITFWIVYLIIRTIRSVHQNKKEKIIIIMTNFFLIFIITNKVFTDLIFNENIFDKNIINLNLNYYKMIVYCIFPLAVIFTVKKIYKLDTYEIILKFWPIYCVLFIELTINIIFYLFPLRFVNDNLLNNRIPQFFFHFYYYIPIIYFILRGYNNYSYQLKIKVKNLIFIYNFFFKKINNICIGVSYLIIFKLLLFATIKFQLIEKNINRQNYELKNLINNPSNYQKKLISDTFLTEIKLLTNLDIRANSGLYKNFVNNYNKENLKNYIQNLVIFCKINNWNKVDCKNFFSPGTIYKKATKISLINNKQVINSGAGYFLYFNYHIIEKQKLDSLHEMIDNYFDKKLNYLLEISNIDGVLIKKTNPENNLIKDKILNKKIKIIEYD